MNIIPVVSIPDFTATGNVPATNLGATYTDVDDIGGLHEVIIASQHGTQNLPVTANVTIS